MKKQGQQAANGVDEDQVRMSGTFNDPSTIDYVLDCLLSEVDATQQAPWAGRTYSKHTAHQI